MQIGSFAQTGNGFTGTINAFGVTLESVVFERTTKANDKAPDFRLTATTPDGEIFEIGAAWSKTSKEGREDQSVSLDGPTLAAPVYAALTEKKEGGFGLYWERQKPRD